MCEVRPRRLAIRRDAHEANDIQTVIGTAPSHKCSDLIWSNAGLLRLTPDIDLHEAGQLAISARHLRRQRLGQTIPVYGLDHIKQGHRVADLVGLQRSNQVQGHVGIGFPQARPFIPRLLNAIFAKHSLTGAQKRHDPTCRDRLGDSNQRHRQCRRPKAVLGSIDAMSDGSELAAGVGVHAVAGFLLT